MGIFQVILFITVVIGIMLITLSLFIYSCESIEKGNDYLETSNTVKMFDSYVAKAQKAMSEFDATSKLVFSEIDERYQELLYLYTKIEDKKKEIDEQAHENKVMESQKAKSIASLKEKGYNITEIAKRLGIGQGEVKLIIELGKIR